MLKVNMQSKIKLQKGASLIEVLIALFLLAVGLLGVLAMQTESLKLNQQSYGSTQALFLANDAVERMRTNIMVLAKEDQSSPTLDQAFPTANLNDWKASVVSQLPGGIGDIAAVNGASSTFKITITYPQQSLVNENKDAAVESEDITYVLFASL